METTIDAQGKKIGRTASVAAHLLMDKNSINFQKHTKSKNLVHIVNVSKAEVLDKKKLETIFRNYSGYPGGLKETNMTKLIERKGMSEVMRLAVYGMIPNNKLKNDRMKHLKISE